MRVLHTRDAQAAGGTGLAANTAAQGRATAAQSAWAHNRRPVVPDAFYAAAAAAAAARNSRDAAAVVGTAPTPGTLHEDGARAAARDAAIAADSATPAAAMMDVMRHMDFQAMQRTSVDPNATPAAERAARAGFVRTSMRASEHGRAADAALGTVTQLEADAAVDPSAHISTQPLADPPPSGQSATVRGRTSIPTRRASTPPGTERNPLRAQADAAHAQLAARAEDVKRTPTIGANYDASRPTAAAHQGTVDVRAGIPLTWARRGPRLGQARDSAAHGDLATVGRDASSLPVIATTNAAASGVPPRFPRAGVGLTTGGPPSAIAQVAGQARKHAMRQPSFHTPEPQRVTPVAEDLDELGTPFTGADVAGQIRAVVAASRAATARAAAAAAPSLAAINARAAARRSLMLRGPVRLSPLDEGPHTVRHETMVWPPRGRPRLGRYADISTEPESRVYTPAGPPTGVRGLWQAGPAHPALGPPRRVLRTRPRTEFDESSPSSSD